MSRAKITAVIIAKNEEKMLPACLETLSWCDELLLIDCASTDKTVAIAEKYGARVIGFDHPSFAKIREKALESIATDYLFYVDADERVTPALAKEILVHLENNDCQVMQINRENICYGKKFNFGGLKNDQVLRVFHKNNLKAWRGEIHESPVFSGHICQLNHQLIHLTHRSTKENLAKSASWTIKEANLLAESKKTKKVTFLTILRKGFMEFYRQAFKNQGRKDGMPGLIEALVQGMNRMFVYIQVWELQQKPSLEDRYHSEEMKIKKLWKTEGSTLTTQA
jgi:glycosyltransferase involved in cell wall biosynthesis